MSAPELWLLPPEPSPIRKTALPWFGALTPIALSVVLFVMTRSPLSLVLAILAPATMWLTLAVTRKREHQRIREESASFDREVDNLLSRASVAHARERKSALRSHPDAFLLGYTPQRSALSVQGAATTARAHALKQQVEINPMMPVFATRKPQVAFTGTLANRLRCVVEHHFEAHPEEGELLIVERVDGQLVLRPDTPLHLSLPPSRALLRRRAARETAIQKQRTRLQRARTRMQQRASRNDRATLEIELGQAEDGSPVIIDVVREGPHALIAGSTGSGKSELLRTLVAQISRRYTPEQVQFLLVDFKGGTAMQYLEPLPHVLELLTDLEHAAVVRVVQGLTAEIRRREQVLRAQRASDCAQLPLSHRLSRLVIVVDEFATLVTELPELHAVFADIAARGRSLGMHLVVATQRPGGVVRDALAANCALRFCLRVTSPAEGLGVLGVASESSPVGLPPGNCVLASNGHISTAWKVTRTPEHIVQRIAHDQSVPEGPARPWLPPLPERISTEGWGELSAGSVYLGLSDEPNIQEQNRVSYRAEEHGPLLIVGGRRSGKTNACHHIANQWTHFAGHTASVAFAAADPSAVWQQLRQLELRCDEHEHALDAKAQDARLWIFDDVDQILARFTPEQLFAAVNTLSRASRQLPKRDALILTTMRASGPLAQALSAVSHRLNLRALSRDDHVASGLPASSFNAQAPPGRGEIGGISLQLALASQLFERAACVPSILPMDRPVVVVTSRLSRWRRFGEHPETTCPAITIAESSDLLTRSRELVSLRREALWILDRCSPTEVKQLLLTNEPPPPVNSPSLVVTWCTTTGFSLSQLPHWAV